MYVCTYTMYMYVLVLPYIPCQPRLKGKYNTRCILMVHRREGSIVTTLNCRVPTCIVHGRKFTMGHSEKEGRLRALVCRFNDNPAYVRTYIHTCKPCTCTCLHAVSCTAVRSHWETFSRRKRETLCFSWSWQQWMLPAATRCCGPPSPTSTSSPPCWTLLHRSSVCRGEVR